MFNEFYKIFHKIMTFLKNFINDSNTNNNIRKFIHFRTTPYWDLF